MSHGHHVSNEQLLTELSTAVGRGRFAPRLHVTLSLEIDEKYVQKELKKSSSSLALDVAWTIRLDEGGRDVEKSQGRCVTDYPAVTYNPNGKFTRARYGVMLPVWTFEEDTTATPLVEPCPSSRVASGS